MFGAISVDYFPKQIKLWYSKFLLFISSFVVLLIYRRLIKNEIWSNLMSKLYIHVTQKMSRQNSFNLIILSAKKMFF